MKATQPPYRSELTALVESGELPAFVERLKQREAEGELRTPDELAQFANVLMLRGESALGCRQLERAFEGYKKAGRPGDAALMAIWLLRYAMDRGDQVLGMTWLRRAEQLVEGEPPSPGGVHVAVVHSMMAGMQGRQEDALAIADEALEIARQVNEPSELALAWMRRGRVLIRLGRVDEGQRCMDEAMLLATSGEAEPAVRFVVYCGTIDACEDVADYGRAAQWTDVVNEWCETVQLDGLPGLCRVHRGALLRLRGDWAVAERELSRACELLQRCDMPAMSAAGVAELGMIRLRAGDLDRAEQAFKEAHQLGHEPQPGLSLLRLRRGQLDSAAASIARALAEREGDPLPRAKLLPAQVEIALARGDVETANRAAGELEEIAESFNGPGLVAHAQHARGAVALASDRVDEAVAKLRSSLRSWNALRAPYESACVRRLLAEAHEREGDPEQARLERETAHGTFASLGATLDVLPVPEGTGGHSSDAAVVETVAAPPAARGSTLIDGKLTIRRPLGRGAMGAVFEAEHRVTGRRVALKMVHPHLAENAEHCSRLLQEALACGRIQHPNVIDVLDAGNHAGVPYLVMELLQGETLAERIEREGAMPVGDAVDIARQALAGVGAAHDTGVVHRDLKPANLFLASGAGEAGRRVKVLDFGISKLGSASLGLTQTGAILGTPYYMAPEQAKSDGSIDERTDVYAMAAVLYEMLVGEPPFVAPSAPALLVKIMTEPFPSARERRGDVPEGLDEALLRAAADEPSERYPTARAFAEALEGW